MNVNITEQLRQKLTRRVERLKETHWKRFHTGVCLLLDFINREPLLRSLVDELQSQCNMTPNQCVKQLNAEHKNPSTEAEESAIAYMVLKYCQESANNNIERDIAHKLHDFSAYQEDYHEQKQFFFDTFVMPFCIFLEERIDTTRIILGLLRRYKHHCEWFRRSELLTIFDAEKARSSETGKNSRAEKQLALHLYEFLHSQGLSFSIEPFSISGEADLIAAQESDDPLIADVKIFDPSSGKNKAYVISGFHQVFQYTHDYNEPFGYLVIFKTCEEGLSFSFGQHEQSTSFVTLNGKTIFFIVIDIFDYEKSASKRGKLTTYIITEQALMTQKIDTDIP